MRWSSFGGLLSGLVGMGCLGSSKFLNMQLPRFVKVWSLVLLDYSILWVDFQLYREVGRGKIRGAGERG